MNRLALVIGKFVSLIGEVIGKGSGLPGQIALKISPKLLKSIEVPKKVIMVTGTNGKTSVTKYVTEFYKSAGKTVVTNSNGANVLIGIATTLVKNSTFGLKVPGDVLVLEVDEGNLPIICKTIVPEKIIVTNLFQDQVDRFGSAKALAEKMAGGIPNESEIFYNGDDPMVSYFASLLDNSKYSFGLALTNGGASVDVDCPKCGKPLEYKARVYDHLGEFDCQCGYAHEHIDFCADNVNGREFTLSGFDFQAPEDAIYMIYNSTAALSVALSDGLEFPILRQTLRDIRVGQGRLEKFEFNGEESFLNLIKNPAGANLSIDLMRRGDHEYNLLIAVNNREADGVDTSWLDQVAFSSLMSTGLKAVYVSGEAANQLKEAVRKQLPNVEISIGQPQEHLKKMEDSGIGGYFLGNYTALASVKKALVARKYL